MASRTRVNIAANFAGSAWTGLMSVLFVPVYVRLMGIETYGLVGFFAALQALTVFLDLGLSTTLNRELAALSALPGRDREMRDLTRTLSAIYWGVGLLTALALGAAAPVFAGHWLKAERLAPAGVHRCLLIMAAGLLFSWPTSLYSGGLIGLQRIVPLNVVNAAVAALRGVGAIPLLVFVSKRPEVFFAWQGAMGALQTLVLGGLLARALPRTGERAKVRPGLLRDRWRFAAGLSGSAIGGMVLAQMDKVILSKVLPLERFGYYALAASMAQAIYRLVTPITAAVFPGLSERVAAGDGPGLARLYHGAAQLMSAVLLPVLALAVFFPDAILWAWTRDGAVVANARDVLRLLVVGTVLNGLLSLPVALQWAHRWTRLHLAASLCAALVLAPATWWLARRFGMVGAAAGWVCFNAGYLLAVLHRMHRRVLPEEKWAWYLWDVGVPLALALGTAGVLKALSLRMQVGMSPAWLAGCWCVVQCVTTAAVSGPRRALLGRLGFRTGERGVVA